MENPLLVNWFWPALSLLMLALCLIFLGAVLYVIRRDNKRLANS